MFSFRALQSCAGQEKWHPLTLQKVFRQVKLSFEDLVSILLLFLQAAVPCSAGEPLAMRFVVGSDKHQLPEQQFCAGFWLKGCPGLLTWARLWTNHY